MSNRTDTGTDMNDTMDTTAAVARHARYPDLAGKIALVTGGSRGIGAATASALAAIVDGVAG